MILTAKYDGEFDEVEKDEILKMISDFYSFDKNKIDRKFDHLINILGADHAGYIKRISSSVEALSRIKK